MFRGALQRRRRRLRGGDGSLTFHQDFLLPAGTAISSAVKNGKGPSLTFTRASDARSFNEGGTLVAAGGNDFPRFDHDPANNNIALGILPEHSRTNICLQSEALGTTWTNPGGNTTITDNAGVAPDGATTADDVLHNDNAETIQQTITVTDNERVAISAFVKQGSTGSHDFVKMSWLDESDGDNGFEVWFDLATGDVGTAQAQGTGTYTTASAVMLDVGSGWYRISAVGQIVSGQTDGRFEIINTTADAVDTAEATNSVFWWGLQVEESDYLTSYIPTTTVAVSRAQETITTTDMSWFVGTEGTFYIQSIIPQDATNSSDLTCLSMNTGGGNPRSDVFQTTTSGQVRVRFLTDGDGSNLNTGSGTIRASFKLAYAWAEDDIAASLDGAAVVTDSSLDISDGGSVDQLWVGAGFGGISNNKWNHPIAEIRYYNVRKANQFLIDETT